MPVQRKVPGKTKRTAAERRLSPARRGQTNVDSLPPFEPDPDIVTFRERDLKPGERIDFDTWIKRDR